MIKEMDIIIYSGIIQGVWPFDGSDKCGCGCLQVIIVIRINTQVSIFHQQHDTGVGVT